MKTVPFWVDDHPRPEGLTSELPAQTDYLIVGAGLTGLSTASRLSNSGATVTVVDAGEIAAGASSINGGMVSPDVKAGVEVVARRHGPEIAREMWHSTVRSVEMVRQLAKDPGIDAVTHEGGMAALGRGSGKRATFEDQAARYRAEYGADWEVIGPEHIGTIVGGDYFDVALYEPEGFGVHPARLSFGLARNVNGSGVVLVDGCEASSIDRDGAGFKVATSRGEIRAGTVVLATNGYTTPRPSPELARRVVSIGSYVIVTEALGERAARIFPSGSMTYIRRRLLNYMRRTHDDRVLLGGRRNLHPGLDLAESARALRNSLLGYWPDLADAEITHVWGGRLGVPFDLTPHIGQIDGVWYAVGYAGHGVGLSVQLGHELAGMLIGTDPPSVYSKIPHDGRWYFNGTNPWFLTPASLLYRALDLVGR